jgi:hypothetical protein
VRLRRYSNADELRTVAGGELWRKFKGGDRRPVASLPGFEESLRILLVEERYTASDVALMFGVTRERVRQWAKRLGIALGYGPVKRIWVDEENRFRPVPSHVRDQILAGYRRENRTSERRATIAARQAHIRAACNSLRSRLGRDPTARELAEATFGKPMGQNSAAPFLIVAWYGRYDGRGMPAIRQALGLGKALRGWSGRPPEHQVLATHCGRGHEFTEENTGRCQGKRYCRACHRILRHESYARTRKAGA